MANTYTQLLFQYIYIYIYCKVLIISYKQEQMNPFREVHFRNFKKLPSINY